MWYAEKKLPVDMSGVNEPEYQDWVNERLAEIHQVNPGMSDLEARVREVVSRYRGDIGLSRTRVDIIVAHLMEVINPSSKCPGVPHSGHASRDWTCPYDSHSSL